jgi:hypothetical protein
LNEKIGIQMNADLKDKIITTVNVIFVFNSCGFPSMANKGKGLRPSFYGYYY